MRETPSEWTHTWGGSLGLLHMLNLSNSFCTEEGDCTDVTENMQGRAEGWKFCNGKDFSDSQSLGFKVTTAARL